jgi:hypothetical protein
MAATILGIYTLGRVLSNLTDQVFDRIEGAIEKATESQRLAAISTAQAVEQTGLSLQIEAGRQVKLALDQFKNCYKDSLEITIEKLNPEIQKNLETIKQLIENIINPKIELAGDLAVRVEQFIHSLPGIGDIPYLFRSLPNFIDYSQQNRNVLVQFYGRFPKTVETKASFTINGRTFSPIESKILQLTFQVPSNCFYSDPKQVPSLAQGELKLAWIKNGWVSNSPCEHQYKIWIGVLPPAPGKVSLIYRQITTERLFRHFVSPDFFQSSATKGGKLTIINKPYSVPPEAGWKIVRGSSKLIVIWKREKNSTCSFHSDDKDQVIYHVSTIHSKTPGKSGEIQFRIEFDQYLETTTEQEQSEEIPLKWRETRVIDAKKGAFKKVTFTSFEGVHYEMSGANSSNPLIKITNQGGNLVLNVASPETLSFFPQALPAKL